MLEEFWGGIDTNDAYGGLVSECCKRLRRGAHDAGQRAPKLCNGICIKMSRREWQHCCMIRSCVRNMCSNCNNGAGNSLATGTRRDVTLKNVIARRRRRESDGNKFGCLGETTLHFLAERHRSCEG